MKPEHKTLPTFTSEEDEARFWQEHDAADYLDLNAAQSAVFTNLKPTTRSISLRLPESLLSDLKVLANQRDVPYQSLIKIFLAERVKTERLPLG